MDDLLHSDAFVAAQTNITKGEEVQNLVLFICQQRHKIWKNYKSIFHQYNIYAYPYILISRRFHR